MCVLLGFFLLVCEFGREGKIRLWEVGNIGGNREIFHTFCKNICLDNNKLMLIINIFLILKIL